MPTKINFSELNLQDALDLAVLIENEAQERYLEFEEQLGYRYEGDAAFFFRSMAANEAKHARQLSERRAKLFKDAPVLVNLEMIWDVEAPDPGLARSYMSPRQAAELALESERKAFQFFDNALKHIKDPEVIALFTELRAEELEHENMLHALLRELPMSEGADLTEDDIDEPAGF